MILIREFMMPDDANTPANPDLNFNPNTGANSNANANPNFNFNSNFNANPDPFSSSSAPQNPFNTSGAGFSGTQSQFNASGAGTPGTFGAASGAAADIPQLTLNPNGQAAARTQTPAPVQQPEPEPEEIKLTPEERRAVEEFSHKIDLTDSNMILQYGAAAQNNIASFSESALESVRTKDLGEVGQTLANLVTQLQGLGSEEEQPKGLKSFFKKPVDKVQSMKARYDKAEANVDKITKELEQHQITLLKDVAMLDQMYELNLKYYKELTMYIMAGKMRLEEVRNTDLEELRRRAEQTGSQDDAQRYNDLLQMCGRFDKKLHDLDLTRMICIQMGPQTRMLQNNDIQMAEKIQSSIVNTIPLWKNQMVLALGLEHGRQATAAQNAVTDMTNEILRKNAEMLKMGTIATAREAERGIVDIETLQKTNQDLISTIDEVLNIQRDGAAKRKAAETELRRIEGELRQKLMELNR